MKQTPQRTSISHPLIINTVSVSNGELGLTFCPGKKQANALTGSWDRDVSLDIESVKQWGATAVISLLEDFEYDELSVRELPAAYQENFQWFNLPIPDKCTPDDAWLTHWLTLKNELKAILENRGRILIHCKGGFGRTGTVAALILIDHGHNATDAIAACRRAREFAVETSAQESFVLNYDKLFGSKPTQMDALGQYCLHGARRAHQLPDDFITSHQNHTISQHLHIVSDSVCRKETPYTLNNRKGASEY